MVAPRASAILASIGQGAEGHAGHVDRDVEHHGPLGARADDGPRLAFLAIAFDDETGERSRKEGQIVPMGNLLEQREAAHAVAAELRLDVDVVDDLGSENLRTTEDVFPAFGRRAGKRGEAARGTRHS